ncbi:hypothetical protein ABTZ46_18080 [Nocardioides sp. NPDC126508]
MGAAIISGLFAVVLACVAWGLQNGSRRARLLSRIERYTQILRDLPYGHPARAHLDAALAAEAAHLRDLTGSQAPPFPTPGYQQPSYAPAPLPNVQYGPPSPGPATMDDIFGPGDAPRPAAPSPASPPAPAPAPAAEPTTAPPIWRPARSSRSLQTYASLALGLLAGGFAIVAVWLAIDQFLR